MDPKQTINTLNTLIENSKDAEYGFRSTSEYARSDELKRLLLARAAECQQAAAELQTLVIQLGGDPEDSGTVAGAAHRGWVAVKGTLAGYSDLNMLEEAERGEDVGLARYRSALETDLPPEIRLVVMRQFDGAQRNHDQIKALRNQERARA